MWRALRHDSARAADGGLRAAPLWLGEIPLEADWTAVRTAWSDDGHGWHFRVDW